jgi:hypothetical protein
VLSFHRICKSQLVLYEHEVLVKKRENYLLVFLFLMFFKMSDTFWFWTSGS